MQEEDIKIIVRETLTALGFDLRNPQSAQADMIYLRKIRIGSEMMTTRMKLSIAGIFASTAVYLFIQGLKAFFKGQ